MAEIFENGFSARDPEMALREHLAGGNGLIATSRSKAVAREFAVQNQGHVYAIDNVGGAQVKYPNELWFMAFEREVTLERIDASRIRGACSMDLKEWTPNPRCDG